MTIALVDQAVDQKGKNALPCCQQADFVLGYKYPFLWAVLINNFKRKNSHPLSVLATNFKRVLG